MKLMAFDYDLEYVKGNMIPHVDTLSYNLKRNKTKKKLKINVEDEFLHWAEMDVLPMNRIVIIYKIQF